MKTDFKFSNLLGTVYTRGNLLFSPNGNSLLSPVGNRVTVFDLVNNKSYTLPFAHRRNIARLALNPQGNLLLTVDEDGRAILTNLPRRIALFHFSFRTAVTSLVFSPSGRHFAAAIGRQIEVWHTPSTPGSSEDGDLEFAPFVRHRIYTGHFDEVQSIEWSSDSRFFLTASKDLSARIWSLNPEEGFIPTSLSGHRQPVLAAWFSKDQETIYTISKDGALFHWGYVPKPQRAEEDMEIEEEMQWRIIDKHYFMQDNAYVTCAAYHASSNLLVAGFSNGIFGLYELPDFSQLQTLSISQNEIDFVSINQSGEWLAFGASKLGQLLVWEWQSESYILKQQSHFDSINSIAYSPDGQRIITTADDGKIKVWDVTSGFCIVTFTEHTSGVTACEFAKRGNVLFTASLDGSVRAWDLIRYRNFRTFTAPTRLSFSSLAVDPSGEVVCAGSLDSFDIHVWSVQTGQLLDQLSAHEGPVASLAFSATGGMLASGSWDRTVRLWSVFGRTQTSEPLQLQADVLSVAFRPDSKQIAVSTLDGQLSFWSVSDAVQQGGVDGRRDASGGRKISDRRTAANVAGTKSFATITYSADGSCVLAGGNSKYICLYEVQAGVLIKKFTVSVNLSLDGTQEFLNSKLLTEAGPRGLIDEQGEESDLENRIDRSLPGASRGDASTRKTRPEVRVSAAAFSPTGRAFCASSTEGLLIYSLDNVIQFDPFDLDVTVTPDSTRAEMEKGSHLKALVMAFRLNDNSLVRQVFEHVPAADIPLVVKDMPTVYLDRFLRFVAVQVDETPHLEFNLLWTEAVLRKHGRYLKDNIGQFAPEMRAVMRAVGKIGKELGKLSEETLYLVEYLLNQPAKGKTSGVHRDENGNLLEEGEDGDGMEMEGEVEEGEGEWIGFD
ncbi:WD40 repeat-like protein [Eremomyces bilateralis CBS 781.70]|uniref:WD40 repeat-like protein n=1 Tax=Eremomyces bilateralis CBS 781.70 TaxID=1392243 RepID=A0A6G1G7F2_9PEZI|nr:WD40 repeat-like protein [Eremomyces bilateralis CBS 781.70]KAF1813820.1 WD40 repeat-like protein [Eremomyces bilateralis CBS 781.70]